MASVTVEAVRPLMLRGERHETGERIACTPLEAGDLVDSGRAVLGDQADAPAVLVAKKEALDAALRIARRRTDDPTSPPWQQWPR